MKKQSANWIGNVHPNFVNEPEMHHEFSRGFSPSEFARVHHVHKNTVYAWIRDGRIKTQRVKIWIRYRYQISCFAVPPVLKSGPVPRDQDAEL